MHLWQGIRIKSNYEFDKSACGDQWMWKRTLDDYDIWYVLSGEGEIYINGTRYKAEAGTCCILRPGDQVEAYHNPKHRFTLIYYHFSITDEHGNDMPPSSCNTYLPPRHTVIKEPKNRYWMEQYLHSLLEYSDQVDCFSKEMVELLLKLILALLHHSREAKKQPSHSHRHLMRKIALHIEQNISKPICRKDIAQLVALSPRYASRLFKEYSGYSIKEYIKHTRLNKARALLIETNQTVTQIAESLGYTDIYFFSNQFKQHYGVSPLNYRKHMRRAKSSKLPVIK